MTGSSTRLGRRAFVVGLASLSATRDGSAGEPNTSAVKWAELLDETERMNRALRSATRAGEPFRVPPGPHRVAGLVAPEGARIVGAASSSSLVQGGKGPVISVANAPAFQMSDLAVEGSALGDPDWPLVSAKDCAETSFVNLRLSGARGTALQLARSGGRVERCRFSRATVGFQSLDATNLVLVANEVSNCADNGIQIWRSAKGHDGTQVISNRVWDIRAASGGSGQNGNGINVFRAGTVMVANNYVRDCAFSAIRANSADNVQIVANQCERLGEVAIFVEFGFEGAVVANNVVTRASAGISITNFDQGGRLAVVNGNLVRDLFRRPEPLTGQINQGYGIAIEADAVVTANVVEAAEYAGILVGYGPYLRDAVCANNLVRRSGLGIAVSVAPGAGKAQISGNVISGSRSHSLSGYAWDKLVSADLAADAARFPSLSISGNMVQ